MLTRCARSCPRCTRSRRAIRRKELNDSVLSLFAGNYRGADGILAGQLDGALENCGGAVPREGLTSGYWKMYTIVIQLGAILCLPVYFRKRIAQFLSTFPQGKRGDRNPLTHPLGLVMAAFVVYRDPRIFDEPSLIGKHLESLYIMGTSLLIGGIVMWIVDELNSHFRNSGIGSDGNAHSHLDMEDMSLGQAIWIGRARFFRRVPRNVAIDVHDRGGAIGRDVACVGTGVFIFSFHPDDGRGNWIRFAEVVDGKFSEPPRRFRTLMLTVGGAGHWVCRVVRRGLRDGGMVYGMGKAAGVRTVCGYNRMVVGAAVVFWHCGRVDEHIVLRRRPVGVNSKHTV